MATTDEVVIIVMFCISLLALAGLLTGVILSWRSFAARDEKWEYWLKENTALAPEKAIQWLPLMSRQEILDQGEMLDTAMPAVAG